MAHSLSPNHRHHLRPSSQLKTNSLDVEAKMSNLSLNHRLFLHPDLWTEIFEQLAPSNLSPIESIVQTNTRKKECRKALLNCALTCRDLSGLALDVLWRVLDDASVLFKVLPNFQRTSLQLHGYYYLSEEVPPSYWVRFQSYAMRIRELRMVGTMLNFHPSVWTFVNQHSGGASLLPRLRRANIMIPVNNPDGYLRLLPPSLCKLDLTLELTYNVAPWKIIQEQSAAGKDAAMQVAWALFHSLPSMFRNLSELWVHSGLDGIPMRLLESVSNFSQLRELQLQHSGAVFDQAALEKLSHIPPLRHLEIRIDLGDSQGESALDFGEGFQHLVEVRIQGHITDLCAFFQSSHCMNIVEFVLYIDTFDMDTIVVELPLLLSSINNTVTKLSFNFDYPIDSGLVHFATLFGPLLAFGAVTSFYVETQGDFGLHMSDADLQSFANAWPHLTFFRFDDAGSGPPLNEAELELPTIASVIAFARCCPALEFLWFDALDVRALPPASQVPAIAHPTLKHLSSTRLIGGQDVNLLDLAVIIDRLCPEFETPASVRQKDFPEEEPAEETPRLWELVSILLAAMQRRRREDEGTDGVPEAERR